jgi:flagellar biosynthesis/type III secretory pathway protein FliH
MTFNAENEIDKLQEIFQGMPSGTLSEMSRMIEQLKKNQQNLYNNAKIEGFAEGEKVGYQKGFIDGSTIIIEDL